ncbi:MAG: carbamoylphosphate synthase large subunit short form [Ruminococcus sp.]|nr:carbamoylphosphate synthase large subunit short form [Ruminococcus sp.]
MGKKIGVLVFPAGEVNSIELHDALSACVNIRLFGASSVDRHGQFVFENYISGLPSIGKPDFLAALNKLIDSRQIDIVIPTHDDIALFLAKKRETIKAKVLTSDYQTALICRDKRKTYETFADFDFCPRIYHCLVKFPVFIKPRKGQGSVNARLLSGPTDIPADIDLEEYVVCEYLPGQEMTVDCFTDYKGTLQAVLPRSRQRVFGGVSVRGQKEELTEEILDIAQAVNAKLHFTGLWYFQIKQGIDGRFKLMEISVRCAGTMCLSRALGVNLPLLSVYAAMGKKTEVLVNDYDLLVDRTLISRYKTDMEYSRVYIDLDDTILINGKVNLQAIYFLYQCVNSRKQIILLTRHRMDHEDTAKDALMNHKIMPQLFDEVIELDFRTPKYKAIQPEGAIFVDNSFAERKSVYEAVKIPVFDVDGIEVLLDWRR